MWNTTTGKFAKDLLSDDKLEVRSVAFSPTDLRLLAVGYSGTPGPSNVSHVSLWNLETATELARLPGATDLPGFALDEFSGVVGSLTFSPDGQYLVAGFGDKLLLKSESSPSPLKVWEVATRKPIQILNGHTGYCASVEFSREGARLASCSHDGTAIIWSTIRWDAERTLRNPDPSTVYGNGIVADVAFSPDGKTLALASREGTIQLWDVAAGTLQALLKGHSSAVCAIAFSPDGLTLASGSTDQTVRLWNVETRRELMQLDPGRVDLGEVTSLSFSSDGKHLLAGGRNDTAVWSAAPIAVPGF